MGKRWSVALVRGQDGERPDQKDTSGARHERHIGIARNHMSEGLTPGHGHEREVRDEPGGCPLTGQVVSGVKAARARSAALARNVGRRAATRLSRVGPGVARGSVWRQKPKD